MEPVVRVVSEVFYGTEVVARQDRLPDLSKVVL